MSFQPVLPLGGYAGWAFLKRTMETQQASLEAAPSARREEAYFREKIGAVDSAADLVADRRLLTIAATAYGLEEDAGYRAFLERILAGGALAKDALANRLADSRYSQFAAAFGFGDLATPRTKLAGFADEVLDRYRQQKFEAAIGDKNQSYRLALNAEHALTEIAGGSGNDDTKWYRILGNAPLREVVQTALGLPDSFARIDIDQQLGVVKTRMQRLFGDSSASQFARPEAMDRLIRTYIVRDEVAGGTAPQSPAAIALQLLGG